MDPIAAAACETILNTIRLSGLNWSIQESPFSLSISIRKTFVKVIEKSVCSSKPNIEAFPIPSYQTPRKTFPKTTLFENKKSPQYISQKNLMSMPSSPIKYPTVYPSSLSTIQNMCPKSPCEIQVSSSQKVTRLFPNNAQPSQISNRIQYMESKPGLVNLPKPPLTSPTNNFQHIPALMQSLLTPLGSIPSSQEHCTSPQRNFYQNNYSPINQLKKVPSPNSKSEINPTSTSKTTSMDSTTTQFTERKDNLSGQKTHAYISSHKTFLDSMSTQNQLNPTPTQDQLTTPTQDQLNTNLDQLNTNPTQDQLKTSTTLDQLDIPTTKDQLNYTATQDQLAILTNISEETFPFKYKPRAFWDDSDSDVDYSDDEETTDDLMRKLKLKYQIT